MYNPMSGIGGKRNENGTIVRGGIVGGGGSVMSGLPGGSSQTPTAGSQGTGGGADKKTIVSGLQVIDPSTMKVDISKEEY
jgi:hypothetical protein